MYKELFSPERILILPRTDKNDALAKTVKLFEKSPVNDLDNLLHLVLHREEIMSTGIGVGIAVPHARVEGLSQPCAALSLCPGGISDYQSIDNSLVRVIAMIAAVPHQHQQYIQILAALIKRLKEDSFMDKLLACDNTQKLYEYISS